MASNNGPTPRDWPKDEDRFHKPYCDFEAVDSSFSIAINERNWIPAGDKETNRPAKRTNALGGFFRDED